MVGFRYILEVKLGIMSWLWRERGIKDAFRFFT